MADAHPMFSVCRLCSFIPLSWNGFSFEMISAGDVLIGSRGQGWDVAESDICRVSDTAVISGSL